MAGLYKYLQRAAHEQPVIFYSVIVGSFGPLLAISVPPIRKSMGWKMTERIPTSYPGYAKTAELAAAWEHRLHEDALSKVQLITGLETGNFPVLSPHYLPHQHRVDLVITSLYAKGYSQRLKPTDPTA